VKIIKGTSKGFFGNVLDAARHISHALNKNQEWYIDWNSTPYNDAIYGPNAWEYFYCNAYSRKESNDIVGDYTDLKLSDGHNFRQTMNYILTNFIILNEDTKSIIIKALANLKVNDKTLGIHIRKTDKLIGHVFGEPSSAFPLDVSVYIKYIDQLLPTFDNVFIASDESEDLRTITNHISKYHNKPVSFTDAFRSQGSVSIHNNYPQISGYKKGLDVLTDCYILSNCGHLIRSTSNVGSTAQFLNLNLTHTNINEKELGDTREQEYNL